jgi:hypothetical protein
MLRSWQTSPAHSVGFFFASGKHLLEYLIRLKRILPGMTVNRVTLYGNQTDAAEALAAGTIMPSGSVGNRRTSRRHLYYQQREHGSGINYS